MSELPRRIRHAARRLLRTPGSTAAAVLTLALGSAAVTLAHRAAWPVLVRPLPFPDAERLIQVRETFRGDDRSVAPANYLDWRERAGAFSELAAWDGGTVTLVLDDGGVRVPAATVSGNFFATLGAETVLGRTFDPAFRRGGERVAVISHALWTSTFGGDPGTVGSTVRVDDLSVRVVGVLRPDFGFAPEPADLWLRSPDEAPEIRGAPVDITTLRDAWYFHVVGRLAPGVELERARAELDALAAALREEHPGTNVDAGVRLEPLAEAVVAERGASVRLLLAAAGLVLVVAGLNVTHLLLARSWSAAGDRAVRRALGASRGRLAGSAVLEGLLLAGVGVALGTAAAELLSGTALGLVPGVAESLGTRLSGPGVGDRAAELALALGLALGATLLVSALPAALAARTSDGLRSTASRSLGDAPRRARLRWGLVGLEAALALALVTGSGLLLESVRQVVAMEPGFEPEGLWTTRVALPDARGQAYEERVDAIGRMVAEIESLPGVGAAGAASASPLALGVRAGLSVTDRATPPEDWPDVVWRPVTPGYLEMIGVETVSGRGLTAADDAGGLDVAVVNEALVREAFPDGTPLGRQVTVGLDGHDRPLTIVGVVSDTRNRGPAEEPSPVIYRPVSQTLRYGADDVLLVARAAAGATLPTAASFRQALLRAVPSAAPYATYTGPELVRRQTGDLRRMLGLLAGLGGVALMLGGVGVYGVASGAVRERRGEIGLRLALGAPPARIVGGVAGRGLAAVGVGLLLGIPLAAALARSLGGFLVGVTPGEPRAYALGAALLLAGAAAAVLPAALDGARTDPARTLRE